MILAALAAAAAVTATPPPADAPDCDAARHALFLYTRRAPIGTKTPPIACRDGKVVPVPPEVAAAVAAPSAPQAERTPNLYHQPSYCRQVVDKEVERQRVAMKGLRPATEYAVYRQLDGCAVPTPVGYHPSTLPGAADPSSDPAKREDAPSNRR
jgi:hypothetical protein